MSTTAKKGKQQSAKSTNKREGFTAEEKAAMRARARELKDKADGESAVRASIAAIRRPASTGASRSTSSCSAMRRSDGHSGLLPAPKPRSFTCAMASMARTGC